MSHLAIDSQALTDSPYWPPRIAGEFPLSLVLRALLISPLLLSWVFSANATENRRIAQLAFPSTVLLVMQHSAGQPVSQGSGFFVLPNTLATNAHVLRESSTGYAKLVGQNRRLDIAGVVAIDMEADIALLSVTGGNAPALTLGDSQHAQVGDEIFVIGNPKGLEGTFSSGIISGIRRSESENFLQITAPISPGSSGGPVLDSSGRVVGIATASLIDGQNLNFAIPASSLTELLKSPRSLRPLNVVSGVLPQRQKRIGNDLRDSVICDSFEWEWAKYWNTPTGKYTFSIRNKLPSPISNIKVLVVFRDENHNPIDFQQLLLSERIPAGLAKRMHGFSEDSVTSRTLKGCYTDQARLDACLANVEPEQRITFRVLDFVIDESE